MGLKVRAVAVSILVVVCTAAVLMAFAGVPDSSDKQSLPSATPWSFAWEMGKEDVPLDGQLTIRVKGAWEFVLLFQSDDADRASMSAFLGDGSYEFVPDASPQAKRLIPYVDGTLNELHQRANRGEIIRRPAKPGTKIRVELLVEEAQGEKRTLLSRTVDTVGVSGYVLGGQLREVAGVLLEPGIYKVQASVSQPLTLPVGVRMSLAARPPRRY